jgi:hypothetical protein
VVNLEDFKAISAKNNCKKDRNLPWHPLRGLLGIKGVDLS